MITRHLILISCLICSWVWLVAQEDRYAATVGAYTERYAGQLYQGKLYGNYPPNVTGHPSYRELGVVEGSSIVYGDVRYEGVPLMYDLVRNQLVTRHPDRLVNIVLPNEQVSSFTIGDAVFVYLDQPEKNLPSGFYQQIAESPTVSCYAKWTKEYWEDTRGTRLLRAFNGQVAYYLLRKGQDAEYRAIRSQGALLRSFKSHRRQLRRALFDQSLSFNDHPEATLAFVLDYVANH